jgi:hypothetical protein
MLPEVLLFLGRHLTVEEGKQRVDGVLAVEHA